MEITKALCLSTAHISAETTVGLERGDYQPMAVWRSEWGYFIPCYGDKDESGLTGGAMPWPADLIACRNKALEAGCSFLRLDSDGLQVPGLEVFEW